MINKKENYYQRDQLCTKRLIAVYRFNVGGIWKSEKESQITLSTYNKPYRSICLKVEP